MLKSRNQYEADKELHFLPGHVEHIGHLIRKCKFDGLESKYYDYTIKTFKKISNVREKYR